MSQHKCNKQKRKKKVNQFGWCFFFGNEKFQSIVPFIFVFLFISFNVHRIRPSITCSEQHIQYYTSPHTFDQHNTLKISRMSNCSSANTLELIPWNDTHLHYSLIFHIFSLTFFCFFCLRFVLFIAWLLQIYKLPPQNSQMFRMVGRPKMRETYATHPIQAIIGAYATRTILVGPHHRFCGDGLHRFGMVCQTSFSRENRETIGGRGGTKSTYVIKTLFIFY